MAPSCLEVKNSRVPQKIRKDARCPSWDNGSTSQLVAIITAMVIMITVILDYQSQVNELKPDMQNRNTKLPRKESDLRCEITGQGLSNILDTQFKIQRECLSSFVIYGGVNPRLRQCINLEVQRRIPVDKNQEKLYAFDNACNRSLYAA
ncbi:hypothetical protein KM043_012808 [Ampulex compressa]|nr:hypothetical protein KM043_012808 [Ampulex compressa]